MKHISGKTFEFHEKHNAWVINRCPAQVNLTGGSWFESTHYKTEQEVIDALDLEFILHQIYLTNEKQYTELILPEVSQNTLNVLTYKGYIIASNRLNKIISWG